MNIFSKKTKITSNIAFMGIMAAFNVVFVLLANFIPLLTFMLVFFLPLTSLCVALFCQKKYLIIYVIASLALCILFTMHNFSDTLFYVVPSIISGITFGLIIDKKIPLLYGIIAIALLNLGVSYLTIPLIKVIYEQDIISVVSNIFNVSNYPFLDHVVPAFILLISLIETLFCYIVIFLCLPKLNIKIFEYNNSLVNDVLGISVSILVIIFAFTFSQAYLLTLIIASYFMTYSLIEIIFRKRKIAIILSASSIIIAIILLFSLYRVIAQPLNLVTISFMTFSIPIINLVDNYFINKSMKVE